jgi:type IV pilus assembly protein PilB
MEVVPLLSFEDEINMRLTSYTEISRRKAIADFKKENDLFAVAADIQGESNSDIGSAPIVRLINSIMEQAVRDGASDIHIEPMEKKCASG